MFPDPISRFGRERQHKGRDIRYLLPVKDWSGLTDLSPRVKREGWIESATRTHAAETLQTLRSQCHLRQKAVRRGCLGSGPLTDLTVRAVNSTTVSLPRSNRCWVGQKMKVA